MKVRRGKTPLEPRGESLRSATTDNGQMVSTICDAESTKARKRKETEIRDGDKEHETDDGILVSNLPTRLSTKLTFRSHWRTRVGGGREQVDDDEVLL